MTQSATTRLRKLGERRQRHLEAGERFVEEIRQACSTPRALSAVVTLPICSASSAARSTGRICQQLPDMPDERAGTQSDAVRRRPTPTTFYARLWVLELQLLDLRNDALALDLVQSYERLTEAWLKVNDARHDGMATQVEATRPTND